MSFKTSDSIRILRNAPFIRILIPFIIGIVLYALIPQVSFILIISVIFVILISLLIFNFASDFYKLKYATVRGIFLFNLYLCASYCLCYFNNPQNSPSWYVNQLDKYSFAVVKVSSELEIKPKSIKAEVEFVSFLNQKEKTDAKGKAFVYFKKEDSVPMLQYGDLIIVRNNFKLIPSSTNPGAFDYGAYCKRNGIYCTAFLKSSEWKSLNHNEASPMKIFIHGSEWTRSILKKYLSDSSSHGIAEALLVGYRKDMDSELWQAYSNAGIVHIIAISGMHMALVFGGIRYIIFLIPFFKKRKKIALILALLAMWIFACVTGLPPSVTRSAVMLSFIAFGDMLERKMSIYNNLSLSAFLLLCYNPNWLFDVGFQLSYLAVLSLVIFYEPIKNWFYISNKVLSFCWNLLALSLAAQLLTLPLCIYYFHQIPLLFLLTNLIAVPFTTIIIYLEIVLVFFAWLEPVAVLLGKLISFFIWVLNLFVIKISGLTYAVYGDLQINLMQVILLYLILISFSIWLLKQKSAYVITTLISVLIFLITFVLIRFDTLQQKKLIVYQTPRQSCVEFIHGDIAYSFIDDSVLKSQNAQKYIFKPSHNFLHITKESNTSVVNSTHLQFCEFAGKNVAHVFDFKFQLPEKLESEFVIISGKQKPSLDWFQKNIDTKQLILDGSVPFWHNEAYRSLCNEMKIQLHITNESGAFVTNF